MKVRELIEILDRKVFHDLEVVVESKTPYEREFRGIARPKTICLDEDGYWEDDYPLDEELPGGCQRFLLIDG